MTDDNERQAVAIKANLSSYVSTVGLGFLTGAALFLTYILQNRSPWVAFYIVLGLASCSLLYGLIVGGDGQNDIANLLAHGTWTAGTKSSKFNRQSYAVLAGIILVLASLPIGLLSPAHPANNSGQQSQTKVTQEVTVLQNEVSDLRSELNVLLGAGPCGCHHHGPGNG